jgi:hypothetical protein
MSANSSTAPSVCVALTRESGMSLPSQEGRRGRPRKNGRVYVRSASPGVSPLPGVRATREALATLYGIPFASVAHYPHDCIEGLLLSFIIPGLSPDSAECYVGEEIVVEPAPE